MDGNPNVEELGVNKFKEHLHKSRQSLMYVVERVRLQAAHKEGII